MTRKFAVTLLSLLFFLSTSGAFAQRTTTKTRKKKKPVAEQADAPDFSLAPAYLEFLRQGKTIQPAISFQMGDHSALHNLASEPVERVFGDPNSYILGAAKPLQSSG